MKKSSMFEKYPDVVEVDDLRKMLGGISRRLAYRLLAEQEIRCIKVPQRKEDSQCMKMTAAYSLPEMPTD